MQIKHLTAQKSLEIAWKCVQKDVINASNMWFWNGTNNNNTFSHMLLDHCYIFGLSLYPSSLWLFEEEDPVIYFSPALDLGGSGLKQQHLYGTMSTSSLPSFIKIHQAVLEKNLKMWKVYRRTGRWTENGRRDMTIAHLSLRLRWAKS